MLACPQQLLCLKQGFSKSLSSQMMTPIQRVTRYTLLLREIEKDLARAGENEMHADILRAYEVMLVAVWRTFGAKVAKEGLKVAKRPSKF